MLGRNRKHQSGSGSPQASAVGGPRALSGPVASFWGAPRRRLLLEDGHAATTVLIVGVALLFLLVIVAPAIRALQSAVEVLP